MVRSDGIVRYTFVVLDIRTTPESAVMKWGFVLFTAYTGPLGVFLYVLGCREPIRGLHERYTAIRWRQVLGSTIHCVAGDGAGILAGAVIAAFLHVTPIVDIALEYVLGFGFGWTIFQALFMQGITGGSYSRAISDTFLPELLSMNGVMAGMVPVMTLTMARVPGSHDPLGPTFWFIMSMALLAGFAVTYPINWWLVANNLKHGMMTVRPSEAMRPVMAVHARKGTSHPSLEPMDQTSPSDVHTGHSGAPTRTKSREAIMWMIILTFVLFAVGLGVSFAFGGL